MADVPGPPTTAAPASTAPLPRARRRPLASFGTFARVLWANPLSFVGFLVVVAMGVIAVVAWLDPSLLITYGPQQITSDIGQGPSWRHPFGTDELGRDIYTNVVLALPLDLGLGFSIAGVSLLLGGALGLVAGFWDRPRTLGGAVSVAILRLTDVFLSFPSLILALAITASLGRGVLQVVLAIVVTWWPYYVRLVRGEVLAVKHQQFVTAARAAGVTDVRILFRHVVRNILDPLVVYFTLDVGTVLVTFSTISFIATPLPYPGPQPEWGSMIEFYRDWLALYPWTVLFPGAAVFVMVLAFSLLGDGLRDVLDPRSRRAFVRAEAEPAPMSVGPFSPPPPVESAGSPR